MNFWVRDIAVCEASIIEAAIRAGRRHRLPEGPNCRTTPIARRHRLPEGQRWYQDQTPKPKPHRVDVLSCTGVQYRYRLDARGTNIGDFVMFGPQHGLVIERGPSQGRLDGFKAVYEVILGAPGTEVGKTLAVDLLNITDPDRISEPAQPGDVGLGERFAFPFSVGRHAGSGRPDDNEFIVIRLADRLVGAPPDDAPPPVIPEIPVAALLPLAGIALFAAAAAKRQRAGRAATASYRLG